MLTEEKKIAREIVIRERPGREVEVEVEQREDELRRVGEGAREIQAQHCNFDV